MTFKQEISTLILSLCDRYEIYDVEDMNEAFFSDIADEVQQKIKERVIAELNRIAEDCPNCDNNGGYPVTVTGARQISETEVIPYPEQELEQCQWCYEMKNSKFNIENRIKELEKGLEQ